MGFENIDHFDLMVSDVDRAVTFYQGLGVETTERKNGVGRLVKQLVLGDSERINLTTPPDTESQGRTVLAGGGHVCFAWRGTMDEVLETCARNGIAPRRAPRPTEPGAVSQVFFSDPDNNLVEIMVYPK